MCQIDIDECASTPCQHGAKCIDRPNAFECECSEGFTGTKCEINENDCNPDPCHYGTCEDGIAAYTCICTPGYKGPICSEQIDECQSQPCQNGGTCQDRVNDYKCRCPVGTSGVNCEINYDDCASNPCDYGICRDGINRYDCVCSPGYTGPMCNIDIDECASNPCQNGGTCVDEINRFVCRCLEGYHDPYCKSEVDECKSGPCIHGTCVDDVNSYRCECHAGWAGVNCDVDKNECESNPCQQGGTCENLVNGYRCLCVKGFKGSNCQININECASNPCLNKGVCVDKVNGYQCVCSLPYTGKDCEFILAPCSSQPCENGGVCSETEDYENFVCTCTESWQGRRCSVDVDECVADPCKNAGACENTPGSYNCQCLPGYAGVNCETNINDCTPNPCQNGGSCIDGINTFSCSCVLGFTGDKCQQEINECFSSPCLNGGNCSDYVNSYVCACPQGFNGIHCENNMPDCTESSCFNDGTCIDGINSYTCHCQPGFTGSNCQFDINECDSKPCQNGGTCIDGLGSYRCSCPSGYSGKNCQTLVNLCNGSPCKNGGKCVQQGATYHCNCWSGWTGLYCDVPDVSCEVAAFRRGLTVEQLCQHSGNCINTGNSHRCQCMAGYTGSYCQLDVDDCASNPCRNGATCKDYLGSYACECVSGYRGLTCETEINECSTVHCQNGGTCIDLVNDYKCSCPPGTAGIYCEINNDDCEPDLDPHTGEHKCLNGGRCVDRIGGYSCICPPGFIGERCEGDVNECLSNPCDHKGMLDCVQLNNDYLCRCRPGFTGRHCETVIDLCFSQPCQNGGMCVSTANTPLGYTCQCRPGVVGVNCEHTNYTCGQVLCQNGGVCSMTPQGPKCKCLKGFGGSECHVPGCATQPCRNGGTCLPKSSPPFFTCSCPTPFSGQTCTWRETQSCLLPQCKEKARDRICDQECNNYECEWDGGDCSLNLNPWENCTASLQCWKYFNNNECDEACNTAECLFDNFACRNSQKSCNPFYEKYCADHYRDGRCDQGCNNEECGWDGLDCVDSETEKLAKGMLVLIVLLPPEELLKDSVNFLRKLGSLLHTTLRFKKDSRGAPMIFPYYGHGSRMKRFIRIVRELGQEIIGSEVYLEIDNRQCLQTSEDCFPSTDTAAAFIAAQSSKGTLPYPIESVTSKRDDLDHQGQLSLLYLVMVAVGIIILILILGVVAAKRKRKLGPLWFPEGFTLKKVGNRKRREPVGQDAVGMKNLSRPVPDVSVCDDNQNEQWMDEGGPEAKKVKTENQALLSENKDQVDHRPWTQQHLVAADIRLTPSLALTPPQGDQDANCMDVNVRGPDGFTPLMLASLRGGGLDTGIEVEEDAEDSSANVITDLIYQGASLHSQTDRTGETSLHLAARYARADAAKCLLDAGADANAQDNMGRSPLHAAVAADAQGVFQILIRNRATDLDCRMNDGTTPLILAARLAVEGMVVELINCHADVNAVDDHGKSALHWAAAVNNVDATRALLKNGANKDMQDNKEETPLFLAAREGSFEATKILLDHFSNRDITDHMDRLPRDIAQERMHHDIVQLLDEYNLVRSPQGLGGPMVGPTMSPAACPNSSSCSSLKLTPTSKKARKPSTKSLAPGNAKDSKEAKARRRKRSIGNGKETLAENSVALSPVESLESPHTYLSTTSPPLLASSGVLQQSPAVSLHPSIPVQSQLAMSFSNLSEMKGVNVGSNSVLSQVLPAMSHSSITGQGSSLELSLGRVGHVNPQQDWMNRMGIVTSQYNPLLGILHQVSNSYPTIHQQNGLLQSNMPSMHMTMVREQMPQLMTYQSMNSSTSQPAMQQNSQITPPQGQPYCSTMVPVSVGSMHQMPEIVRLPNGQMNNPMVSTSQEGQASQITLPAYHKLPSSVQIDKYPTPPSQHSYVSATDNTPNHNIHLQSEHPYLTPSPESPDQWSSSSPHSTSDWSDITPSPAPMGQRPQVSHLPEQQRSNTQVFA
ncbi:neurogenic locus notch homolog protein 2-like isoform X2 [Hemitrygon akajei]